MGFLKEGKLITGKYYADLLDRFDDGIDEKSILFGEEKTVLTARKCTSSFVRISYRETGQQKKARPYILLRLFLFDNKVRIVWD